MNLTDLNALTALNVLTPQTATATATSAAAIDLSQFEGVLKLSQHVGTVSGTTPSLTGQIQDSADGVTFANVSGLAFTAVTASNSFQSIQVDTRACRRYIQYVGTITGTTPSFTLGVWAVGMKKVA